MIFDSKNKNSVLKITSYLIIGVGIFLRLAQYFSNKSLWRDEILLALNIMERSMLELFKPLDYNQYAPIGFLIIQKLIISFFGTGEFALRLFPFICSIGSLFFFYKLSEKCISKRAVPIAVGIFAILVPLLYYSSETKQYSSDVLIAILLVLLILKIETSGLNVFRAFLYGTIGGASIWFSHTAVFILVSSGIYITLNSIIKKDVKKVVLSSIMFLLWVVSFATFYYLILIHTYTNKGLTNFWDSFYLSLPFFSATATSTYKKIFFEFLRFSTFGIPAFLGLLIGFISLYRENKKIFFILTIPIFVTLIASLLHKYPLFERFLLFLIPLLILFIAEGAEWVKEKTWNISPVLGILIICALFYKPLYFTKENFTNPITQEEIKPVLKYVKNHLKNNDVIYVSNPLQYTFKYYAPGYDFCNNFPLIAERGNLEEARCDAFNYKLFLGTGEINKNNRIYEFEKLKGNRRVWFLFSEKLALDIRHKSFTLKYLDKIGVKTGSFIRQGIGAYLYDLNIKPSH